MLLLLLLTTILLTLIVYRTLPGLGTSTVEGFTVLGYPNSFNINPVKDSAHGTSITNIFSADTFTVKLGTFFSKCFS